MMQVQIIEKIPPRPSASGKMTPPKVKLSDGVEAVVSKGIDFDALRVGSFGEATVSTKQNGQYTNHVLESFVPVTPPGSPAPSFPHATDRAVEQTAYAKADAKDRGIAALACSKAASEIVAAMIRQGMLTDEAEIVRLFDGLSVQAYTFWQKAQSASVATAVTPFDDQ